MPIQSLVIDLVTWMAALVVIGGVFYLCVAFFVFKLTGIDIMEIFSTTSTQAYFPHPYKLRRSVMNGSEAAFFFELQKQLPEFHVFPKMRVADIVETMHGAGYYKRRNEVLPKHVDFLLCDGNFKPLLVIELNGSSHNRSDRWESDRLKEKLFKNIGLPFEFVYVGDNFEYKIANFKETLSKLAEIPSETPRSKGY